MNNQKILLLNIALRPNSKTAWLPIGIGYIATALKKQGIVFDIFDIDANRYKDAQIESYLNNYKYDIYLIGTIVTGYSKIKKISKMIRSSNEAAIIICGNTVASSIPDIILKKTEVNIAVIGEGDITIVKLVESISNNESIDKVQGIAYLDNNEVVMTEKREVVIDIDTLPSIDWSVFDVEYYINKMRDSIARPYPIPQNQIRPFVINTARGCPFRCSFCYHAFINNKYRFRSPESVISEIRNLQTLYNINYVNFFDELTFHSKKHASDFANTIIKNDIKLFWNADIRANLFKTGDEELLERLKKSGCLAFGYSLESGSHVILQHMNKKISIDDFIEQKYVLDRAGIKSHTSIVLGYPEETIGTIRETFNVLKRAKIYPSAGFLLPQPGTPMYDYALKNNIIKDEEDYLERMGDRQDFYLNLTNISKEEFIKEVETQLSDLACDMGVNLPKEQLIKTGTEIHN